MEHNFQEELELIGDSGDESEYDLSDTGSVFEEDYVSEEDSGSEDEENVQGVKRDSEIKTDIFGKDNKTIWTSAPQAIRVRKNKGLTQNRLENDPGVHPSVPTHSVSSTFEFFITDQILVKIVDATNQMGHKTFGRAWEKTDSVELKAWIGLHIRAGVNRDGFRPVGELFSAKDGPPIYGACMTRERFKNLKKVIRFDNSDTRELRKAEEREGSLAPIQEIFDMFLEACNINYKCSKYVTIDESVLPFRGRCSFKVYMPKKPDKYGIKIWSMADAQNSYLSNAQIYRGKSKDGPEVGQFERVVRELSLNIQGTGRNITMDNLFSSVKLAKELLSKGLTMIGTMRKNKVEIPPCFQASKTRDVFSTEFGFSKEEKMMICSYVPRKRKAVTMLSTHHYEKKVQMEPPFKPSVITDYNKNKGGVDTLDQLVKNYTCKRVTKRWPLLIFYWMIDVGSYNSSVCFLLNQPHIYQGPQRRRKFLMDLSEELVLPLIKRRAESEDFRRLHKQTITKMEFFLPEAVFHPQTTREHQQKRCGKCPRQMDRKTRKTCSKCSTPICENHTFTVCSDCV